jgi:acetyl-CoA acyltransferase
LLTIASFPVIGKSILVSVQNYSLYGRVAVVVGAVRTAIGRRNEALAQAHAVDLTGQVLRQLRERTGIDPVLVDDVIWDCVGQVGDQAGNIGQYGVLAAGWPESVPGTTINRACESSQQKPMCARSPRGT